MRVFSGSVLAQGCSAESPRHPHGRNSRLVLRASLVPGAGHPGVLPLHTRLQGRILLLCSSSLGNGGRDQGARVKK